MNPTTYWGLDKWLPAIPKLASTLRICATLALARTFGRYEHSGWNGEFEYARYSWRGKSWAFPTSPIRPYEID